MRVVESGNDVGSDRGGGGGGGRRNVAYRGHCSGGGRQLGRGHCIGEHAQSSMIVLASVAQRERRRSC